MDIGIGLPNAVRGVDRAGIVEFARRADAAGFSSLGTIDRLVYPNYESLITLAAAAAVTERIRLATDILIAPLRNTVMLAKQAATLDGISDGRLVLGLAVGGRADDYEVVGVDFHRRGRIFDQQLEELLGLWRGAEGVGPAPMNGERPTLLIGGNADASIRRAAKYADGWTQGGGTPDAFSEGKARVEEAWAAEGRDGRPRTVALFYFALGEGGEEAAREDLLDYYAWLGDYAQQIADSAATDPETLKGYLAAFESAGADEVICFAASDDPGQVDLLAEVALAGSSVGT
jgi:alkanesulfonate monooxygenase SsuD/methylene tetrahydromethanopterin reductase-like flavin-dependent oxidoreductase (luciferase family)